MTERQTRNDSGICFLCADGGVGCSRASARLRVSYSPGFDNWAIRSLRAMREFVLTWLRLFRTIESGSGCRELCVIVTITATMRVPSAFVSVSTFSFGKTS